MSLNTPTGPDSYRPETRDTFFEPAQDLGPDGRDAVRPAFGTRPSRLVGHYDGTPPQAEALRVADPARGRAPVGMDIALLAYSGISVKMLVDRTFGAELLTMFTVDYEPNGAAQIHDHPFEEVYFFLDGEIDGVLDGETVTLRAGDVAFAGVGSTHGFFNTGDGRVRWIETQAPQPPARHAYRWVDAWKRFRGGTEAWRSDGCVVVVEARPGHRSRGAGPLLRRYRARDGPHEPRCRSAGARGPRSAARRGHRP